MTLSTPALTRMRTLLTRHIEQQHLPGLVAILASHDDLHTLELGTLAFPSATPMRLDTVFRIASLTKVIVAVAAMILLEDGAYRLDDPIDPWLPELASPRVLRTLASPLTDTVPATRSITVRDLLTYRTGTGSIMAPPGTYPIQQPIRDLHIGGDTFTFPGYQPDPAEWLRRLASLPLLTQPGEAWHYHVSGDVLGVLLARVSGLSLGDLLKQRIFAPLGMHDTAFQATPDMLARMPALYMTDYTNGGLRIADEPTQSAWTTPPAFESAGGGLLSTAADYLTFSRMLLNHGTLPANSSSGASSNQPAVRILSPASVNLMTSPQLTAAQREAAPIFFGDFSSWGLGLAVDVHPREIYHFPGRFGWTGGYGTTAYIDPAHQLIGILFTQRAMDSPTPPQVFTDFWTQAYAALL